MTLGVIPKSFEDELIHKVKEYPTWRSLLDYCRTRTRELKHRTYADLIRKPKPPTIEGLHAFQSQEPLPSDGDIVPSTPAAASAAPTWANDLINAVKDLKVIARPKPKPKPKAKAAAGRFVWPNGKCWECEGDHLRAECDQWKRICGPSGSPPEGHKGARDKAYAKWKANRAKKLNAFELESEQEYDEEFEYDPLACSFIACGTCSDQDDFTHINSFAELADDDDGDDDVEESSDDPVIDSLNRWAHVVIDAKRGKTSQRAKHSKGIQKVKARISSTDDLHVIKALPDDFAALTRIAKNHPDDKLLRPGEQWVMIDSGANVDAADIGKHFPEYKHLVEPMRDGTGAECASGNVVKCRGRVKVDGSMDGQSTSITFRDMDIRMPIASLKGRVQGKNGFDIFITDDGAIMRHRVSGKLVRLYDRGGVYFCNFRTKLPGDPIMASSFRRLG